jgi:hypothetical protein
MLLVYIRTYLKSVLIYVCNVGYQSSEQSIYVSNNGRIHVFFSDLRAKVFGKHYLDCTASSVWVAMNIELKWISKDSIVAYVWVNSGKQGKSSVRVFCVPAEFELFSFQVQDSRSAISWV